jgi:hypothetical protein
MGQSRCFERTRGASALRRVGPGGCNPEPLTEPDLMLSHHPARTTAGRLPPSAEIRAPPLPDGSG